MVEGAVAGEIWGAAGVFGGGDERSDLGETLRRVGKLPKAEGVQPSFCMAARTEAFASFLDWCSERLGRLCGEKGRASELVGMRGAQHCIQSFPLASDWNANSCSLARGTHSTTHTQKREEDACNVPWQEARTAQRNGKKMPEVVI